MKKNAMTKKTIAQALNLAIASGFFIGSSETVYADQPPPTYTRTPMMSWGSQMDDPLLGNTK